jgi:FAD/FMN-containing dehydrogenase
VWIPRDHEDTAKRRPKVSLVLEDYASLLMRIPRSYVDSEFNREEAHKMYFSEENLKKLKMLKRQYDPNNVFRYPHSIVG